MQREWFPLSPPPGLVGGYHTPALAGRKLCVWIARLLGVHAAMTYRAY